MFSVFATSYRLRITYRVNSIIYSLKQLPLVRRLLPSALYRSCGLKRFACVIAILMEIHMDRRFPAHPAVSEHRRRGIQ